MDLLCEIKQIKTSDLLEGIREPYYYILIFDRKATFSVDFTEYECNGGSLLFLSPYQFFKWEHPSLPFIDAIIFHGDFYCIEYHKKEVACNGVLFNNIYQQPYVSVKEDTFEEVCAIVEKMKKMSATKSSSDISIVKSYLQLILALTSKEKQQQLTHEVIDTPQFDNIVDFQAVLEKHFLDTKKISFYASKFGLSVNTFSKKIKKHFGKSPSKLMQERIVLEAKKLLHLTHKPIKEIAAEMNFEDEFYFSRFFKKEVGLSPKRFREKVGISIVAKSSM